MKLNLLLHDMANEDYAYYDQLVQFGERALRADGIIYLANPLSMPMICMQLPPDVQPLEGVGRAEGEILDTLMHGLKQYNNLPATEPISIPIAITFSKANLLQYIIPKQEQPDYWLFYQPDYDGKAHQDDIRHVDREVRSILGRYGEQWLLKLSSGFANTSFFAVSPMGSPPDSSGKFIDYKPHRCLDPFIWLLWKLNYISAVS